MKIPVRLLSFLWLVAMSYFGHDIARAGDAPKKILFFSSSAGPGQDMGHRPSGSLSVAENVVAELGKRNHLEFTFTRDGSMFNPEVIGKFDAFCLFTSGDVTEPNGDHIPPVSKQGKAALLKAVHNGKGFVGINSAIDAFRQIGEEVDPYIDMIGGEYLGRNAQEPARQIVADRSFPGMETVPENFSLVEDWFTMKSFSTNLHVLLVMDTSSMGRAAYNIPNYPSTWAHEYGTGRVFYNSMGGNEAMWKNAVFQQILAGGLKWAVGDVKADVAPNITKVTPQAGTR